jgi:hypothetical protein
MGALRTIISEKYPLSIQMSFFNLTCTNET